MTMALAALLVLALAFVVGAEVQKRFGTTSSASGGAAASFASRFAGARAGGGGFPGGAAGGGFGGAASGPSGTVTLIKGSTLYVTDFSGNTVKVKASGVKVTKTVTAPLKSSDFASGGLGAAMDDIAAKLTTFATIVP